MGGRHLAGEGGGKKIQKEREGERTIILRILEKASIYIYKEIDR